MTHLVQYTTIKAVAEVEFKRERSRFIGVALPVDSVIEAHTQRSKVRGLIPDASHYCSAHRILVDGEVDAQSDDDGEPLNSAGPPILQVIAGRELLNVLVVVVRYFGGTKLGVGGLIRAYGDAAKAVLDEAQPVERIPTTRLTMAYPHAITGAVMAVLHKHGVSVENVAYAERAQTTVTLPLSLREGLVADIIEACAGQVEVLSDRST